MHHAFGSASSLLTHLVGNKADFEDEYDEEMDEVVAFLNLEHLEDSDEAEAPPAPPNPPPAPKLRFTTSNSTTECSICLTAFDEESPAVVLECGHHFCADCVAVYIQIQTGDFAGLRHEIHKVVPVKPGVLSLHLRTAFGVRCPAHRCKHVLDFELIKQFATERVFERFDGFMLRLAVEAMASDLTPCPQHCGGFLQDDCTICSNEACRARRLLTREKEAQLLRRQWYQGNSRNHELFGEWLKSAGIPVKCCPNCFVIVEKNQGCDHMRCSRCSTSYQWSRAPAVGSGECWYAHTRKAARKAAEETLAAARSAAKPK